MNVAIIQTSQLENRDGVSTSTTSVVIVDKPLGQGCLSLPVNSVVKTADTPLLLLTTRNPAEANTSNIAQVCPSDIEIRYCH